MKGQPGAGAPIATACCLTVLGLAMLLPAGCSSESNDAVTSESIVTVSPSLNLVAGGGFEGDDIDKWSLYEEGGVTLATDNETHWRGESSLAVSARAAQVETSVTARQAAVLLPVTRVGSQYTLTLRAKTRQLSRQVPVEIKLSYTDDSYDFCVRERGGAPLGIPRGTTDDWIQVEVQAIARKPLDAVEVFLLDSGPGRISGSVWVDDVRLRASAASPSRNALKKVSCTLGRD